MNDPELVERDATVLPFAEVADWLQIQLGQQLTAYVAGLRDAAVGDGAAASGHRAAAAFRTLIHASSCRGSSADGSTRWG